MATYKKMLKNRNGDNIIPAFGGQIETDDLADGAITTAKIADGAVTKVGTSTVGATDKPIYLASGIPTQVKQPVGGSWFQGTPRVTPDGVLEIGKYIDFHNASDETKDYSVRLSTDNTGSSSVLLPNSSGRLALESQIPTVNDATLTITQNGTSVGTFTANASSDTTIALTDTTYSNFVGATSSASGSAGLVPAPAAGNEAKVLSGAGTWVNQPTMPTVNNGTLTIQKNGSNVQTFTANSSANKTANITVPTKTQLYTGGTHATTTSTLSQAPSNFDYLFIDVINNDNVINTVVIPGNATKFSSETHTAANNALYIKWAQWNISGSTISRAACYESNGYSALNSSNVFGVKRVVGVKIP